MGGLNFEALHTETTPGFNTSIMHFWAIPDFGHADSLLNGLQFRLQSVSVNGLLHGGCFLVYSHRV